LVRVAVILLASNDRKLDCSEVDLNKKLIKGHILDFVKGSNTPVFKGVFKRNGTVIFNPAYKETGHWSNIYWSPHSMLRMLISLLKLPYITS
jgi:Na+-transporting NADH:ubiquinone oxidoreductase subunit NqrA